MAAHPFGPIENLLFRAYKQPGCDPRCAKPVFDSQIKLEVPCISVDCLPNWAFMRMRSLTYELERTAIVNSSDYDFDPKHEIPYMDLLSRGLGYRITFTMPADREFQIHDQSTWPGLELTILDMFGENVLRT